MYCLVILLSLLAVTQPTVGNRDPISIRYNLRGPPLGKNDLFPDGECPRLAASLLDGQASRARAYVQTLKRPENCSFIVRYRLQESYTLLWLELFVGDDLRLLDGAPFKITGSAALSESCYCPQQDISSYLEAADCDSEPPKQVVDDFSAFPQIDLELLRKETKQRFKNPHAVALVHYVIRDQRLYRRTYGEHVGFTIFSDDTILSLLRKVRLPDIEFLLNLGDWPLESGENKKSLLPIISWCGSTSTFDIVIPTYDFTQSTIDMMSRVTLDLFSTLQNAKPRWSEKESRGFWRGRDSSRERLKLVELSWKYPDLLNASLTNMFFFRDRIDYYKPTNANVPFFDFFEFKYQVSLDGTVAAYRMPYLLAGNALVLKQDSDYYEWFYNELVPWQHYVPFSRNLSDLIEKLQWAKANDAEAEKIAKAAQSLVAERLRPEKVICDHLHVFREYARRQLSQPVVTDHMEMIEQKTNPCTCHLNVEHEEL